MLDIAAPKYLSVAQALEGQIRIGTLKPGRRIPGEHELAKKFDVSRGTVRQALGVLARKRLIRTHPGAGSYVEFGRERLEYALGWTAALAAMGTPIMSRVLRLEVIEHRGLAASLGTKGFQFVALDRIRLLESGMPISLDRSRLPLTTRTEGFLGMDFTAASLTTVLLEAGELAALSEEWVHIHRLGTEEASLLRRHPGDAFLLVRRITRTSSGRPIEHVESILDPDLFHMHFGPNPVKATPTATKSQRLPASATRR